MDQGANAQPIAAASSNGQDKAAWPRRMMPVVLTDTTDAMTVMKEEIFGPILPVVGYEDLDDAIGIIRSRPRPLALYYFDGDSRRRKAFLKATISGGVTLNDTIFHVAQENLPFGGIGASGMGAYHGYDGFLTFSHQRAVFERSRLMPSDLLNPPYGGRFAKMMAGLKWWLGRKF